MHKLNKVTPLKVTKTKKHKPNRKVVFFGLLLIIIGLLGLSYPFWPKQIIIKRQYTTEVSNAFNEETEKIENIEVVNPDIKSAGVDPVLAYVKNRLYIPSIGVNMPLIQDSSVNALDKGGWMFPGTSLPNESGNTVIVGHQFRYRPPLANTFYNLYKLNVGDIYTVNWNDHIYTYKVRETKIVEPTDVSVLNQTETTQLTLITCYPAFSTKQRLIVIGDLVVIQ